MNVAIKRHPHQESHGRGVGVYTRQILKALQLIDANSTFELIEGDDDSKFDIVHYPFFDLFFTSLPNRHSIPVIVTIHDVIPLVFPDLYPPGYKGLFKFVIQKRRLGHVDAIITDSDQSRQDIGRYLNQPLEKVHTIYLAAGDQFTQTDDILTRKVIEKYGLITPYLLYVGDINPTKNLPRLLKVFSSIDTDHQLVLVSKALSNTDIPESHAVYSTIEDYQLKERVRVITNIPLDPIEEIGAIYTGADWYIQPSLYEGFGFPVLEAMACGTPVISSIGGSLKEVVKDAAILFDPTDEDSMRGAIIKAIMSNNDVRESYIQKSIQLVNKYSWQKTAKETLKIYRSVLA